MTTSKARLVLFDLDHTLLPIDSDYCWSVFTTDIGWTDSQVFRQRNDDFYAHYQAGTLDIHDYIRFATEAVRLQGPAKAAEAHARFMREVVQPNLRPEALALVHKHQAAGDQVVIVTATNEFVTRPIATAFGVDELIAVELERGADGWITGGIRGTPSFREGKVSRVEQWLAAQGVDWSRADITVYSDSATDRPLLERGDRPIATNPDPRLRAVAQERGWRILDLFSDET